MSVTTLQFESSKWDSLFLCPLKHHLHCRHRLPNIFAIGAQRIHFPEFCNITSTFSRTLRSWCFFGTVAGLRSRRFFGTVASLRSQHSSEG